MKRIIVFIFLVTFCSQPKNGNEAGTKAAWAAASLFTADCVYCSNAQALGGNCTCYTGIAIGSCTGMSAGAGKSNSYQVKCADLTALGNWAAIGENAWSCNSFTCPPEAYKAAFSAREP